jgi:hypothetical protein
MAPHRRNLVAVTGAILAAGAAGVMMHEHAQTRGEREILPDAVADVVPGFPGTERHGCRFRTGETLGYAVDIRTDATVDPQRAGLGAAPGTAPMAVNRAVHTDLQLEALTVDPVRGAVLLAAYRNLKGDRDAVPLAQPFLLRVDPSCHVAGYARFQKTAQTYGRTQQAIAHELLWRWPQGGGTVEEPDQNAVGAYVARHTVTGGGSAPQIERTVLTYTALWSAGGLGASGTTPAPAASSLVVRPGVGAWFDSLRGDETLSGVAGIDSHTVVDAKRIAADRSALAAASRDQSQYVWENLLPRSLTTRAKPEVTQQELRARDAMRGLTLDQALGSFVGLVKSGKNFSETWPALKTYLEARPEAATELMRRLRANELPQDAEAAAFVALGKAETPEAREALLSTMRDQSAELIDRSRSVFGLLDRPDVGAALTRELASDAMALDSGGSRAERIFARESALAVGMMAGLRGDAEPDIKTVAMATVPRLLGLGSSARILSPAFGAIGNLGEPATLALVQPYTMSPDPAVRAVAAKSIRRMSPEQTGDFSGEWLRRETDPNVKREIYTTIANQTYDAQQPAAASVVQQAIADLQANPGLVTRKAIIKILGPQANTDPAAKAALMKQIAYETKASSGLYGVIAGYLSASDLAAAVAL